MRKITPELIAEAKANIAHRAAEQKTLNEAQSHYGEMSSGQTIDEFMADLRQPVQKAS